MNNIYYVYRFLDNNNRVIYIGKTNNIYNRIENQHFAGKGHCDEECYKKTKSIEYIEVDTEINAFILETYFINKYRPIYNHLNKCTKDIIIDEDKLILKYIPSDEWRVYKKINNKNKFINVLFILFLILFIVFIYYFL